MAVSLVLGAVFERPPGDQPEPLEVGAMVSPLPLVTKVYGTFKTVPEEKRHEFHPVYSFALVKTWNTLTRRTLGWDATGPCLGFFRTTTHWAYELEAQRLDNPEAGPAAPEWLAEDEIARALPVVFAELNRRSPHLGDRFRLVLERGADSTSPPTCFPNAVVLLAWLSLVLPLVLRAAPTLRRIAAWEIPLWRSKPQG